MGWSRNPIVVTGKLDGNRLQYDECAHVIKMFARNIFGITDPRALKGISVSAYFGADLQINLESLGKENAWLVRNLLMDHSNHRVVPDHNNQLNAKAIKYHAVSPSKSLVMTLEAIAKKYDLTDQLEASVSAVQEAQEAKRAAEVSNYENLKTKPITRRGYLEEPNFDEAPSLESNAYFEKVATALDVIAQHCGWSKEQASEIHIVLDNQDVHVRLSDCNPNASQRLAENLVRYSGYRAAVTGRFSHLAFTDSDDVKVNAKHLVDTVNLAIKAYGLENQVASALDELAAHEAIRR